jgi:BarA-like signal transduction histidine kinase
MQRISPTEGDAVTLEGRRVRVVVSIDDEEALTLCPKLPFKTKLPAEAQQEIVQCLLDMLGRHRLFPLGSDVVHP